MSDYLNAIAGFDQPLVVVGAHLDHMGIPQQFDDDVQNLASLDFLDTSSWCCKHHCVMLDVEEEEPMGEG